MSTISVRIKDSVYSRLEMNAKGYESLSDTINRANLSLEKNEALGLLDNQVELSIKSLNEEGITRERHILMHYQKEAITSAMDLIARLYHEYKIEYEVQTNMCCINVTRKK